jgi:hypothetical protein
MKRYIVGAGVALALFGAGIAIMPHAAKAAPTRAGVGTVHLASAPRIDAAVNAAPRAQAARLASAIAGRARHSHCAYLSAGHSRPVLRYGRHPRGLRHEWILAARLQADRTLWDGDLLPRSVRQH